jgi:DNA end-binding protein Ku
LSGRAATVCRPVRWNWPNLQAQSPRTVPAKLYEQDEQEGAADGDNESEEEEAAPVPRQQNTRTIEIERFLPAGQIDTRYFEKP